MRVIRNFTVIVLFIITFFYGCVAEFKPFFSLHISVQGMPLVLHAHRSLSQDFTQSQGKSSNMLSVAGKILIQSIAKFLVLVRWSFNQLLTDHYVYPAIIVLLFYCGMLLTAFPPNPCLIVALVLKDIARNISSKSSLDSCSRIKGYCSQHFFQIRAW